MIGKAGDRIFVESETVGTPAREGEILEVILGIEPTEHIRYRVRWTDGHESIFTPSGGNTRIESLGAEDLGERETA